MKTMASSQESTVSTLEPPPASSFERRIEVSALLGAVAALRRDGLLTEAEYEAKRQRLAPQL